MLSENLLEAEEDALPTTEVEMTYVGGELKYSSAGGFTGD